MGGGITGLTVAWGLVRRAAVAGLGLECHLFEADGHVGGKVRTLRLSTAAGPVVVELGAEAMYAPRPGPLALARELGLGEELVASAAGLRPLILRRGRLFPLPEGLMGVVPSRVGALLRSGLLSWPGKARMGLELLLPPRRQGGDESVGSFVRRRLGREAVEALADPLMAGLHAADVERLSLLAAYPRLRQQELQHGGLLRAVLALRRHGAAGPEGAGPLFWSVRGGLDRLPAAVADALQERGVRVHRSAAVAALRPAGPEGAPWELDVAQGGPAGRFDAVVLAVPTWEAARLVRPWSRPLSQALEAIRYASVGVAVAVYADEQVPADSPVRHSSGVLIGSREGQRSGLVVSACTWYSTKWPHAGAAGTVTVRAFVGRSGDEGPLELGDGELTSAILRDLQRLARLQGPPRHVALFRWPRGMPQYEVGHVQRVERIEGLASRWRGLFVTGAGLRGMSLADCLSQAEATAEACLRWLGEGAAGIGRNGRANSAATAPPEGGRRAATRATAGGIA